MFSGAVKLGGLDDYLGPAQDCVVDLFLEPGTPKDEVSEVKVRDFDLSEISKEILKGDKPDLIKAKDGGGAKVSLYDCLACSGCVTTAEVMLLEAHSAVLFNDALIARKHRTRLSLTNRQGNPILRRVQRVVVTICNASLTALSVHWQEKDEAKMLQRLTTFLNQKGVDIVSTQAFGDAAVLLLQAEGVQPITSHCPGWVCFAEKTCDPKVLEHINDTPTGMLIQGQVMKAMIPETERLSCLLPWFHRVATPELSPCDIFHVAIMPCYDKKLEALRPEFQIPTPNTKDPTEDTYPLVDLVLGTNELVEWLREGGFDSNSSGSSESSKKKKESALDIYCTNDPFTTLRNLMLKIQKDPPPLYIMNRLSRPLLAMGLADESGGMACRQGTLQTEDMSVTPGMNKDFRLVKCGEKTIASLPYGLRNLNNLSQIAERNNLHQLGETIEAMACPSGCILGGAHASLTESNHNGVPFIPKDAYKEAMNATRSQSNPYSGIEQHSPETLPSIVLWNHYLKSKMCHENPSGLSPLLDWLHTVPKFQFNSIKESVGAQAADLNW